MGKWFPGKRGQSDRPFLQPLPKHSETAIMSRIQNTPRRKKLVHRTLIALIIRWRYSVTASVGLVLLMGAVACGMVVLRDEFNNAHKPPAQAAPSLEEINKSIELAQRYITALYKPLPDNMAVQSEASGVPLKARFVTNNEWVLLGEEERLCTADDCEPTTMLEPKTMSQNDETYTATFKTTKGVVALKLEVEINWLFGPEQLQLKLQPLEVTEPVEVWLDTQKLVVFTPDTKQQLSHVFPTEEQALFKMLRFTVRHATQEAYLYWLTYGNDPQKAAALARFLESNNYSPGFDLRAPLFGKAKDLPDRLPFSKGAYPDCDHIARSSQFAYAYRSKVCLAKDLYLLSGARDPFLQAWQALTILQKYEDPNHPLPNGNWWMQGNSPVEIAQHLQGQWNRSGFGIPKCTPFSCNEMSSIRTSVFGTLQTELGYRYGIAESKSFADAAARMVIKAQVGPEGKIRMKDGVYYRPAHVGAYLSAWDTADARFIVPSTPQLVVVIAFLVTGEEPIPSEYRGVIPSNSETTLDALSFLHVYRCLKHGVC